MPDIPPRRPNRNLARTPFQTEIRLQFGNNRELTTTTVDLSSAGAFAAAKPPQPVGTLVRFQIPLTDGQPPVAGYGEVVWIRVRDDGRERPAGMGIQFRYLDGNGDVRLREHLARHAAAPADPLSLGTEGAAPRLPPRPRPPGIDWPPDLRPDPPPIPRQATPLPFVLPPRPASEPEEASVAPASSEPEPPLDEDLEPKSPRVRPVVWAAAGGLALVALSFWAFSGPLTAWLSGAEKERPAASAPRPKAKRPAPAAEPTPAPPPASAAPEPAPSGPAPSEPAPPASPPAAAPVSASLSQIRSITWTSIEGETIVVIAGDGPIERDRATSQRVGGSEPRELLKIAGVGAPYEPAIVTVGTRELLRIRTGHHPDSRGGELFVVFDLPSAKVGIDRLDFQATGLRVYLRSKP